MSRSPVKKKWDYRNVQIEGTRSQFHNYSALSSPTRYSPDKSPRTLRLERDAALAVTEESRGRSRTRSHRSSSKEKTRSRSHSRTRSRSHSRTRRSISPPRLIRGPRIVPSDEYPRRDDVIYPIDNNQYYLYYNALIEENGKQYKYNEKRDSRDLREGR